MRCMTSQSLSQEDEEAGERLPDVALLDAKIAEAERAIAEGETTGEKRRAMERREDLMRLKRVEQIYVRTRHPERRLSSVPHSAHSYRAPSCQCCPGGCSFCSSSSWQPPRLSTTACRLLRGLGWASRRVLRRVSVA